MDGDRIRQAMARIEAASQRIAAAAARRSASPGDADPELGRRHAALRSETGAALRELDLLIEGLER